MGVTSTRRLKVSEPITEPIFREFEKRIHDDVELCVMDYIKQAMDIVENNRLEMHDRDVVEVQSAIAHWVMKRYGATDENKSYQG